MSPVQWSGAPAPRARAAARVKSVPTKGTLWVVFLGNASWVETHWIHPPGATKPRSWPCTGDECPYCPAATVSKGYAAAQVWEEDTAGRKRWVSYAVELTDSVAELLAGDLRGRAAELSRQGPKPNSPLKLDWRKLEKAGELPEPFDLVPILHRLWGYRERPAAGIDQGGAPPPATIPFRSAR